MQYKYIDDGGGLDGDICEYEELTYLLQRDIEVCLDQLKIDPTSEFWRRAFFRFFYSFVDGATHRLKLLLLHFYSEDIISLTTQEAILLQPVIPIIKENGTLGSKKVIQSSIREFMFVIHTTARCLANASIAGALQQHEFKLLQAGLEARNRLTHPRNVASLAITDTELDNAKKACLWYDNLILFIHESLDQRYRSTLPPLEEDEDPFPDYLPDAEAKPQTVTLELR